MDNSAIWINSQPFDFRKSMAFSLKNVNFVPKLAMFRTEIGDFSHQNLDSMWLRFSTTSLDLANHSNCQVLIVKLKIVNWWLINTYETKNYSDKNHLLLSFKRKVHKSEVSVVSDEYRYMKLSQFMTPIEKSNENGHIGFWLAGTIRVWVRLAASRTKSAI